MCVFVDLKLKSVHIRLHTTVGEDFYNHEELSLSHNNLKHVCDSLQREAGSKKILGELRSVWFIEFHSLYYNSTTVSYTCIILALPISENKKSAGYDMSLMQFY